MNANLDHTASAVAAPTGKTWWERRVAAFVGIDDGGGDLRPFSSAADAAHPMVGVGWAVLACAAATLIALALRGRLGEANLVMIYLIAVVLVTVRFGRLAGMLVSLLAVLAFDVFLVPPYLSLTVADPQYLLMFSIMLMVSLIISSLTAELRQRALRAHYGERRAAALFDLARALSGALTNLQIAEISALHLERMFQSKVAVLCADRQGQLLCPQADAAAALPDFVGLETAQTVYDEQAMTRLDNAGALVLYLPLRAPMRTRGVLALACGNAEQLLLPEQTRLLHICVAQIALAIERVHYVDVAQEAMLAVESERLRNTLLSAISHDIRTPLAAIVGLSSTLAADRPLPQRTRQEMAEAIQESAVRMNRLVTNLLDMARLHAGPVRLKREWQMLEEVVGSALAASSAALGARRVEIELPSTLPLLEFDAVLLERIFCNLLDNAAKYTDGDGLVRIGAEHLGAMVQVTVDDDGTGLPIGMEEAIFEKFRRGEPESSRAGVGLGLSICRSIVEAHGGRIWALRRAGRGARFVFTLPAGCAPPVDLAEGDPLAKREG